MARLRGDLEIVTHLLPPARAHSGEVGIIIIAGVIIMHIYCEEQEDQATESPTAFNASAK